MAKQSNKARKAQAQKPKFFLIRWIEGIINFFRGVTVELKKVVWPTKEELLQYTVVVIIVCVIMTVFVWGFDSLFGFLKGLL